MFTFIAVVFVFCLVIVVLQKTGQYKVLRVMSDSLRNLANSVEGIEVQTREVNESEVPADIARMIKLTQPVSLVQGTKLCSVFECRLDDGTVTTLEIHELESLMWIVELYLNGFGFIKVAERPTHSIYRRVFVDGQLTVCELFLPL